MVTVIAAITGMILGTAGFVISVLNYLRDRPRVRVTLSWHMVDVHTKITRGLVRVTNVGRRPIFVSVVALSLPEGLDKTDLILMDSVSGKKLSEGDGPYGVMVNFDGLEPYKAVWRKIRACAVDSTGKKYFSDFPANNDKTPLWAQ